jgi:hypothetical protein
MESREVDAMMLPNEWAGTSFPERNSPNNFIVNKIFRVASKFVRVKKNRKRIFRVRLRTNENLSLLRRLEETWKRRGREKRIRRAVLGSARAADACS